MALERSMYFALKSLLRCRENFEAMTWKKASNTTLSRRGELSCRTHNVGLVARPNPLSAPCDFSEIRPVITKKTLVLIGTG